MNESNKDQQCNQIRKIIRVIRAASDDRATVEPETVAGPLGG